MSNTALAEFLSQMTSNFSQSTKALCESLEPRFQRQGSIFYVGEPLDFQFYSSNKKIVIIAHFSVLTKV